MMMIRRKVAPRRIKKRQSVLAGIGQVKDRDMIQVILRDEMVVLG